MGATHTVSVPRGQWVRGTRHREVELRTLSARDLVALVEPADSWSPAEQLTRLLSRCVARLGSGAPVDEGVLRGLTVGDREALALHVRRLVRGDCMACVVTCPRCRERLDLDLVASDLLVPPYPDARPSYETTIEDSGAGVRVRFRLPTGADQEALSQFPPVDLEAAAERILRRCILEVEGAAGQAGSDLSDGVRAQLSELMLELDPQAMVRLAMACPSCGTPFATDFSPSAYLVEELAHQANRVLVDVHVLASHYHWTEGTILSLPAWRRRFYLGLVDQSGIEPRW